MNEHQLAIGETTYGGLSQLRNKEGIIDYGSLIYITLQRAKNAREAIKTMAELVAKYGYYSSGESFSIADPNEVWILELIGKGEGNKGAVWVARQIPDGFVSGHANQARITTFPFNDDASSISSNELDKIFDKNVTTVYAHDVYTFAKEQGLIEKKVKEKNFSFSDTYAPVNFGSARFCEIRVWGWFNEVAAGMDKYWEYAKGHITHDEKTKYANNRMPLWVKPTEKVDVHTVMNAMRNHLEGTELDMSKDMGAGAFGNPYRWRPLTWKVGDKEYCNERVTATQQTAFSFVAQMRSWLPDQIGGIFWFGIDDAASCVYTPMYSSSVRVPKTYAVGNGNIMDFSAKSAFYVFNQVSNFAYTRYNVIHPEINDKQQAIEKQNISYVKAIDKGAEELMKIDKELAVEFLTDFSVNTANTLVYDWKKFYEYLFVKYMDGNIKTRKALPADHRYIAPDLEQPGYGENWYKKIVDETGEQFLMPAGGGH
jgi:dipeptidase